MGTFPASALPLSAKSTDHQPQLYLVIRFVTPKKPNSRHPRKDRAAIAAVEKPTPSGDSAPFPSLHTPAHASDLTSDGPSSGTATPQTTAQPPLSDRASRLAQLVPAPEPDGATVHCVAVSVQCFKIGRITIPPELVLTCEGFTGVRADPTGRPYSLANPPAAFVSAQALQRPDLPKGHMRTFQRFLQGGWKDVPSGERWFEGAMGPSVEERRKANLEAIRGVTEGMEGAMNGIVY
jgi:hypothetical protein